MHRELLYEALVLMRGANCGICGQLVSVATRCVDHVVAITDGGLNVLTNVQLAHRKCNSKKESNRAMERTLEKIRREYTPQAIVNVRD